MHISHVTIPFVKIAELIGLPEGVHVVGVKEHNEGTHLIVRVVANVMPRDCCLEPGDPLTKIGESYLPLNAPAPDKVDLDVNNNADAITERITPGPLVEF